LKLVQNKNNTSLEGKSDVNLMLKVSYYQFMKNLYLSLNPFINKRKVLDNQIYT